MRRVTSPAPRRDKRQNIGTMGRGTLATILSRPVRAQYESACGPITAIRVPGPTPRAARSAAMFAEQIPPSRRRRAISRVGILAKTLGERVDEPKPGGEAARRHRAAREPHRAPADGWPRVTSTRARPRGPRRRATECPGTQPGAVYERPPRRRSRREPTEPRIASGSSPRPPSRRRSKRRRRATPRSGRRSDSNPIGIATPMSKASGCTRRGAGSVASSTSVPASTNGMK